MLLGAINKGCTWWVAFSRSSSWACWRSPAPLAQGKAELQWFSQAGFKLTTPGGKVIMIDPWIKGATKLPDEFKDLGKLGKVDLILVTHGHGDHLGDAMELAKTNDVPKAPGPARRLDDARKTCKARP